MTDQEKNNIKSTCYGIYDTESNSYRYLFTCNNFYTAKRQFIAYCVGSSDLFSEPLELHSIVDFGSQPGDIFLNYVVVSSFEEVESEVVSNRNKVRSNNDIHNK